jgi:uncharacterized repeat protein (TIGR01451 family)
MSNASRPVHGLVTRVHSLLSRSGMLLIAALLLGFSGQAFATLGCDIQANSATFQQGPAGTTLNYSFDIVDSGGCGGTVSGTVTETSDTTGTFSSDTANWSGDAGDTVNVVITLGPNAGTSASYLVECTAGCTGSTTVSWTAATFESWQLIPLTPTNFTIADGDTVTLGVKYLVNNAPSGLDVNWISDNGGFFSPGPTTTPDVNGHAFVDFTPNGPGTYHVTANGSCPIAAAPTTSCPPTPETFTITVLDPVITPLQPPGGSATIAQNGSILLKIKYAAGNVPAADGTDISWNVSAEPSLGAATLSGGSGGGGPPAFTQTQLNNGTTQVTLNVTVPGTYNVHVGYCPDGCADEYTFTITVLPNTADLSVSKTDSPDPASPGGPLTYTITVANAGPDTAVNLSLSDTLPTGVLFSSLSTPVGWNCSTPAVGSTGTVSCTKNALAVNASSVLTLNTTVANTVTPGSTLTNAVTVGNQAYDPDTSDNNFSTTTTVASASSSLSVAKVLTGTADNDSSGSVSAGDRLDYQVTATNDGNTALTNVVVSDDHFAATQSCPSLAPDATCVLTGSYVVTASDVTAGGVTNVGTATSTQVNGNSSSVFTPIVVIEPALAIGSGDGQTTPPNTPFPLPLTVIAGGSPPILTDGRAAQRGNLQAMAAPGVTISWQVISGSAFLTNPTSVTNASGIASNTATAGPTPGPVVIRATRNDPIPSLVPASVDFHLTVAPLPEQKLGDLPGLNPNQQALADALDELCSGSPSGGGGSASLVSPTSDDLQERCQELIDAIATDPDGVIAALDELFADIALVQSESSLLAAESQFDNIKARIAALRSGTNKTSFGGLALNTSSGRLPIGTMFQSLLDQDEPAGGDKEVGAGFSRWGFFAAGTIGRGDADAGALSPAYDFDVNGLTAGVDYRFSDKFILGGTLGYTKQTNDLSGARGSLDTKGWSVSAFGTWYHADSWYMDGILSWGQNTYDVERHVRYTLTGPFGTTTIDNTGHAEGDGDSLSFALSVGRDFNKNGWGFGPYLRAMYTKMDFDPMTEEFDQSLPGSGFALELDTRTVTSVTSTLGAKLTHANSASWGVWIPHLQLEWQHEFMDDPAEVEARFLFDPLGTPFTIHGDPIDTDFFRFGVGMSFVMTHGRSGFFYYERLISRERFSQNSLAIGIRLEF